MTARSCRHCGAIFTPARCNQSVCSRECSSAAYRAKNREKLRRDSRVRQRIKSGWSEQEAAETPVIDPSAADAVATCRSTYRSRLRRGWDKESAAAARPNERFAHAQPVLDEATTVDAVREHGQVVRSSVYRRMTKMSMDREEAITTPPLKPSDAARQKR